MTDLTLAHRRLIESVAKAIVEDYLRSKALQQQAGEGERPNHPPLPVTDQAA